MMRKTSLIFLGAVAGAGLTLLVTQPHIALGRLERQSGRVGHLPAA